MGTGATVEGAADAVDFVGVAICRNGTEDGTCGGGAAGTLYGDGGCK